MTKSGSSFCWQVDWYEKTIGMKIQAVRSFHWRPVSLEHLGDRLIFGGFELQLRNNLASFQPLTTDPFAPPPTFETVTSLGDRTKMKTARDLFVRFADLDPAWIRRELHLHTNYTDGEGTIEQVIRQTEQAGRRRHPHLRSPDSGGRRAQNMVRHLCYHGAACSP